MPPEQQVEAWSNVVKSAEHEEDEQPKISHKLVEKAVAQLTGSKNKSKSDDPPTYRIQMKPETDDAVNEAYHRIRKQLGENRKKLSKDKLLELIIQHGLKALDDEEIISNLNS